MKWFLTFFLATILNFSGLATSNSAENVQVNFSATNFIEFWSQNDLNFQKLNIKIESDFLKYGHSQKFLKLLFYRSQKALLKSYQQYAPIDALISDGNYDCVSGSLLLAVFLEKYDFDYQIVETSFHVFISVNIDEKELILESTDPYNGFITDTEEVKGFLKDFELKSVDAKDFYLEPNHKLLAEIFDPIIFKKIKLQELHGLTFFNRAIYFNNSGEVVKALEMVQNAEQYYNAKRILALKELLQAQYAIAARDE